jgi:TatD DNase family protein
MHITDSHAHLYSEQFKPDRLDALRRAQDAGVRTIVMPNIDHSSIDAMLELEAEAPENCFAMMGLHPCSVGRNFEQQLYEVETWLDRRPFAAVGEAGLDLHWDKTLLAEQQEALKIQLVLAKKHQLPIVLHTREAFAETVALIEAAQDGTLRGVFHCFSGSPAEAEQVIKLGFKLGIGGVATFKNGGADSCWKPTVRIWHRCRTGASATNPLICRWCCAAWPSCWAKRPKKLPMPQPAMLRSFSICSAGFEARAPVPFGNAGCKVHAKINQAACSKLESRDSILSAKPLIWSRPARASSNWPRW